MAKKKADNEHRTINWRSRIVGHGKIRADQVTPHPMNPRKHPAKQREAVAASYDTLGEIAPIIINQNNGYLVDGEDRTYLALAQGDETELDVIYVDLTDDEHLLALATFDYTTYLAEYDDENLDALLEQVETDDPVLRALMDEMAGNQDDNLYTRKIDIPIYEPSEIDPPFADLYDETKTNALIDEIMATEGLTQGEREFLIVAARRHTVIDFEKVADHYAHASPEVQRLMENSALVIIDIDRAIELGYVRLTERIANMVAEEWGDA